MKLFICHDILKDVRTTPRPGGHPCGHALHALREAGHEPEVVAVGGLGVPVLNRTKGRDEVERLTGKRIVPVLITDDGEAITESKRIIAWAREHPVAVS